MSVSALSPVYLLVAVAVGAAAQRAERVPGEQADAEATAGKKLETI